MDSQPLHLPNICSNIQQGELEEMMPSFLDVFSSSGAIGANVFAEGGNMLFSEGALIAYGHIFLPFPLLASALVAEGLDRSRNAGLYLDFKALTLICWFTAMIPLFICLEPHVACRKHHLLILLNV